MPPTLSVRHLAVTPRESSVIARDLQRILAAEESNCVAGILTMALWGGSPTESTQVAASLSPAAAAAAATAGAPPAFVYGDSTEAWGVPSIDLARCFFATYASISASEGLRPSFFFNFLVAFFFVSVMTASDATCPSSAAAFRRFAGRSLLALARLRQDFSCVLDTAARTANTRQVRTQQGFYCRDTLAPRAAWQALIPQGEYPH